MLRDLASVLPDAEARCKGGSDMWRKTDGGRPREMARPMRAWQEVGSGVEETSAPARWPKRAQGLPATIDKILDRLAEPRL